jgi:UDP-glucose 4-epimerase
MNVNNGSWSWESKSVLVTGGAGFIGSHLVEQLVQERAEVTVIDNFRSGVRTNLAAVADRITLHEADIRLVDWDSVLADGVAAIFHFAANAYVPPSVEFPTVDYDINVAATMNLLECLRLKQWPGRMVFASSAAVYGNAIRVPIREDDPTVPISPYGAGKLASERYVAVFAKLYGLKLASVRFFSAYGPRQRKQVVFDLLAKLRRDSRQLPIHGDGTQVRDFLYVQDAARAAMAVAESGALSGEAYNVGGGREYTIDTLAKALCAQAGVAPELRYTGVNRPGDPEKLIVDITRLRALGYRPQIALEQGLAEVARWFSDVIEETPELQTATMAN